MFKNFYTRCLSDLVVFPKKSLCRCAGCSNKEKFHLVGCDLSQPHLLWSELPKTLKAQSVDSECSYISQCFCSVHPTSLAVVLPLSSNSLLWFSVVLAHVFLADANDLSVHWD